MLFGPAELLWDPKDPAFDRAVITTSGLKHIRLHFGFIFKLFQLIIINSVNELQAVI